MRHRKRIVLLAAGALMGAAALCAQAEGTGFTTGQEGELRYRLYAPAEKGTEEDTYPLVLFLHGENAAGTDNEAQLTADVGAQFWADELRQEKHPSYVLAPQCEDAAWEDKTELVMQMLQKVTAEEAVDESRIYIVGLSSGGTGTWKLLLDHPDVFAAAITICGQVPAEYYEKEGAFDVLKNMPVWGFHAADDDVVPEEESAKAFQALKEAGSNCAKYDRFNPGSVSPAHAAWQPALTGAGTAYNWLMTQSRERTQENTLDPSMLFSKEVFSDRLTRVNDYKLDNIWVLDDGGDEVFLIDTAMGGYGQADLYAYLKEHVLKNPDATISVAMTHSHGDHALGIPSLAESGKLNKLYIHENDRETLLAITNSFGYDLEDITVNIKDGDTITAGGMTLEVVDTPAHTPGSVCFIWDGQDVVFTGDAIGSGYLWMFSYVDEVIPSARHLIDVMEERGLNHIYSGHFENYDTFTIDYAKDILAAAEGICAGKIPYRIYTRMPGAVASVGSGNIYFSLEKINTPKQ